MNTGRPATDPVRRGPVARTAPALLRLGDLTGHAAAAILVVLVISITLGIAMRTLHVDNSWTYDVDLYALIWLAFVGAAYTAVRGHHVTSGVALENLWARSGRNLVLLRYALVAVFLAIFAVSGIMQFLDSWSSHETTLDVMSWPVWIATLAVPVGTVLWLVAETALLLERLMDGKH